MSGSHWHFYITFGLFLVTVLISVLYGSWKKKHFPHSSETDLKFWRLQAFVSSFFVLFVFYFSLLPARVVVPDYSPSGSAERNIRQIVETQTKLAESIDEVKDSAFLLFLGILISLSSLSEVIKDIEKKRTE